MAMIFNDLSSKALEKVIDDNLIEKSLSFPRFFGGETYGPNPIWFVTGPSMPTNNGIAQAVFSHSTLNDDVAAAIEPFRQRRLPLVWWVGPNSYPADMGQTLQQFGFTHNRDMIGMAAPLKELGENNPLPDLPLQFERVEDKEALKFWYEITLQCFPGTYSQAYLDSLAEISLRPDADWIHYIARYQGTVIASSSLQLGAGVAGLYNLGTIPDWRQRGVGVWMTLKTYAESYAMGYQVGTLQSTYPNALRLYHRLGFEIYCKIGIYRHGPW